MKLENVININHLISPLIAERYSGLFIGIRSRLLYLKAFHHMQPVTVPVSYNLALSDYPESTNGPH